MRIPVIHRSLQPHRSASRVLQIPGSPSQVAHTTSTGIMRGCVTDKFDNQYREGVKIVHRPNHMLDRLNDCTSLVQNPSAHAENFVSNCVAQIQQGTQYSQWRHVPSLHNPADSLSRGTDPVELQNNSLWYYGPQWLTSNPSAWPSQQLNAIDVKEQRTVTVLNTVTAPSQGFNQTILNAAGTDSHNRILRPVSLQHHQEPTNYRSLDCRRNSGG